MAARQGAASAARAFRLGIDRPIVLFHRIDTVVMGFVGVRESALRLLAPGPAVHVTCTAVPASMRRIRMNRSHSGGAARIMKPLPAALGWNGRPAVLKSCRKWESTSRGGAASRIVGFHQRAQAAGLFVRARVGRKPRGHGRSVLSGKECPTREAREEQDGLLGSHCRKPKRAAPSGRQTRTR